jgi:hypothetical protein
MRFVRPFVAALLCCASLALAVQATHAQTSPQTPRRADPDPDRRQAREEKPPVYCARPAGQVERHICRTRQEWRYQFDLETRIAAILKEAPVDRRPRAVRTIKSWRQAREDGCAPFLKAYKGDPLREEPGFCMDRFLVPAAILESIAEVGAAPGPAGVWLRWTALSAAPWWHRHALVAQVEPGENLAADPINARENDMARAWLRRAPTDDPGCGRREDAAGRGRARQAPAYALLRTSIDRVDERVLSLSRARRLDCDGERRERREGALYDLRSGQPIERLDQIVVQGRAAEAIAAALNQAVADGAPRTLAARPQLEAALADLRSWRFLSDRIVLELPFPGEATVDGAPITAQASIPWAALLPFLDPEGPLGAPR